MPGQYYRMLQQVACRTGLTMAQVERTIERLARQENTRSTAA